MASNLNPLRERVREVIAMRLENQAFGDDGFLKICTPIWKTQATVRVNGMAVSAGFTTKTGVGAPAASDVRAFSVDTAPVVREKVVPFEEDRLLDLDSLATDIADACFGHAWNEMNAAYFTLLGACRSTAHPDNGVSGSPWQAVGGGTVFVVDNFDMDFLDGSESEQTNDANLSFGAANLSTRLSARRTYKSVGGKADLPIFPPWLVVGTNYERLAKDLVAQEGRFFTGAGADSGYKGQIAGVLTAPGSATFNANGWATVYVEQAMGPDGQMRKQGPITMQIRETPVIRIDRIPGTSDIHVYSKFAYSAVYTPGADAHIFYSQG